MRFQVVRIHDDTERGYAIQDSYKDEYIALCDTQQNALLIANALEHVLHARTVTLMMAQYNR